MLGHISGKSDKAAGTQMQHPTASGCHRDRSGAPAKFYAATHALARSLAGAAHLLVDAASCSLEMTVGSFRCASVAPATMGLRYM